MEHNDPIERLLKLAGSRPQPDVDRTAAFKRDLHAEWRRVTAPRWPRTIAWCGAIAAAAVLVAAWLSFPRATPQPSTSAVLGRIVRADGVVRAGERPLSAGDDLGREMLVETADGRAAIALGAGTSLRVDAGSRLALVRDGVVRLDQGAVYVDSSAERRRPLLIQTAGGDVRDIGTQFEVRTEASGLRVRVREGEVIVDRRGSVLSARAGESLHIDRQGRHERSAVPLSGPDWAWTTAIAPPFELEGSTVQRFLDWVGREQGWRWRSVDADTARRATDVVTHGSIDGYTPEEALAIVLPTCGLSFERHRDELVVSLQKEISPRGR